MIKRRLFVELAGKSLFYSSMLGVCDNTIGAQPVKKSKGTDDRPNIIFFFVDDQRNDTLGCTGHPIVKTPVVDGLAKNGVLFENTFVTTSICAASRASVLTGLPERTHGYTFGKPPVPSRLARYNYPQLMKEAGYRTGFFGKYGCKMEADKSEMFDEFESIGRNPYFHEMPDGSKRHETDLCADNAIRFIDSQPSDQPFCLSVSFNASHAEDSDTRPGLGHFPWPPSTDGMYEDTVMPPPRLADEDIFESQPEFLKESMNRIRYFWRWDTPEKYQTNMRAYLRMLSGIDNAIGRVMKRLAKDGLADNTIIIYAADNGYYMGDRGFAGKWSHYEESLRVPLIIYDPRLPKKKRGRVVSSMALNIDFPATMLDAADVPIPKTYEGMSLMPLVNGTANDNGREYFVCEHLMDHKDIPKWRGIRGKRYVYARYFEQDPVYEFLHDLEQDPDQLKNLADDPAYADVLKSMRTRLRNEVKR